MKKVLLIFGLSVLCAGVKSQCSDLFFSRYIQFGKSNKAFEIFNPTSNPINLTGYYIERYKANSSGLISTTMNDSLHLKAGAILASGGTWVITNPESVPNASNNNSICDSALRARANQFGNFYGTYGSTTGDPTYFKGNDCLVLRNPAGNIVDVFGEIGQTVKFWSTLPTYRGGVGEGEWVSKFFLLERKAAVNSGITAFPSSFNVMAEWDTIRPDPNTGTRQDTVDTYGLMGSPHAVNCPLGIKSIGNNSSVSVYPNPSAIGSITVNASEVIAETKLFTITGQLVLSETGINKTQLSLNTEKIAKGSYLLIVSFMNGYSERKNITIE